MKRSKTARFPRLLSPASKGDKKRRHPFSEMLENRTLLSALTVTTTADVVDGGDGLLSLREAILIANDNAGATSYDGISSTDVADTINFDTSLAGQSIRLNGTQLPTIMQDLTITGLGADQLTIDAQSHSYGGPFLRIFEINSGATARINGVKLTGGDEVDSGYRSIDNSGGAILNFGTLTVTDSMISQNRAEGYGGGIGNWGTLSINDSTIYENLGFDYGGGISNWGTLTRIFHGF